MCLCYNLAVWFGTILNARDVAPNLEWSNTFMGYGTVHIKVQGEGLCPPTPSALNISQFITDEEVEGGGRATLVHGLLPCPAVGG